MTTPSGQRNRRITFERPVAERSGMGREPAQGFVAISKAWAKVTFGSGAERREAGVEGADQAAIPEGTYDPGEIKGQLHYIAGSTADALLITALTTAQLMNFKMQVKTATGTQDQTGTCYVTEYALDDMPVKGKQAASFTLKVTGAITRAPSA